MSDSSSSAMTPISHYTYIRYDDPADAFRPDDARSPAVAARVAALILARLPAGCAIAHIGSSAIPGCAGKGPIDLLLTYPAGGLAPAREAVDALGFQRHMLPGAFPEERPVRIGAITHDGTPFRLHVHIVAATAPEVAAQLAFRDALRADPALVAEYVALKRAVLNAGITTSSEYSDGKDAFIRRVIARALQAAETIGMREPGSA